MSRARTLSGRACLSRAAVALSILVAAPLAAQTAIQVEGAIESTSVGFVFPDGTIQVSAATGSSAPVEDTGQQRCWDQAAVEIPCTDTGQDAESQAGVDWPTPRFTTNPDGTVTDNLTDLVWLQDADCFGQVNWQGALDAVMDLNDGLTTCVNYTAGTFDDWRLANIKELLSLVDYDETGPALHSSHPFLNVQLHFYWSSTTLRANPGVRAWGVFMDGGSGAFVEKVVATDRFAWAVRGGY